MAVAFISTPYTKFPGGTSKAFIEACELTARLIQVGVMAYSPIAHTHPIALHGGIDPLDQKFWYEFDRAMLEKCDTLIVAHMDGWEASSGIAHEIEFFEERGKPIFDLDPSSLAMVQRRKVA